jgi:short-subunit dehydrogenase
MKATEIEQIAIEIAEKATDLKEAEARLRMSKDIIESRESIGVLINGADYDSRDKHSANVQSIKAEIKLLSSQLTNQL